MESALDLILYNLCQSRQIQCQFQANPRSLCAHNIWTSAPCRLIISRLGGRSSRHPVSFLCQSHPIQGMCQSTANLMSTGLQKIPCCPFLQILANPGPFLSITSLIQGIQYDPIFANPVPTRGESDASPRSTFPSKMNSPISQNLSIWANPMAISGHFWGLFV